MKLQGIATGAAALTAAAMGLAACVVEDGPPPAAPERPVVCAQIYAPVCARRDAEVRTFSNECMARGNGFTVVSQGECGGSPITPRPPATQPPPQTALPDRVCPQIYAPVCAVRDGRASTYDNECVAGGRGARVIRQGAC
ncbi:Kazal-type serine protease inhibitor family protein [Oricola cellulosilytica]|uniref:Protease inhibitor n=1 Tax=Oricola cellulosilytica TaxID=1429082 RepID=A0A4V6N6C1_9HYPH|nr:Kazal-type serine protease inhibitor [Oricola cellulosilytica]TCD15317.1 protease inhibitor [Oricola cellulosilytica]